MLAGNLTWDHALATLVGGSNPLRSAERVFADRLLPPVGLVALPWLTRPNMVDPSLVGGGLLLGINSHTTTDEMLRATVLGMCCEFARLFRAVPAGTFNSVVLTGGASRGACFRAMLAGLFAPAPVWRLDDDLFGVRGVIRPLARRPWKCAVARIRLPSSAVRKQLDRHYELYVRTCLSLSAGLDNPLLEGYRDC